LTAAQEYEKAAYYLKSFGSKLSTYTTQEAKILKNLTKVDQITGDKSGNGTVLQLYADSSVSKTPSHIIKKFPDVEIDAMQEHYDRYINLHNSVTVFKLKPR